MEKSDPGELTWEQHRSILFDALDEARTVLLALGLIQEEDEISNEKLIELMSGMRKVEINRRNAEGRMREKNIHAELEKKREALRKAGQVPKP